MTYLKTAVGRALFKLNGTTQSVSSSFCSIASLEVFRGWEQAIEINYQGFTLSGSGSIEVKNFSRDLTKNFHIFHNYQIDKNELAYSIEDLTGELYRMNLVCSNDALPERGSLFFKVLGNTTVTRGQFGSFMVHVVQNQQLTSCLYSCTCSQVQLHYTRNLDKLH